MHNSVEVLHTQIIHSEAPRKLLMHFSVMIVLVKGKGKDCPKSEKIDLLLHKLVECQLLGLHLLPVRTINKFSMPRKQLLTSSYGFLRSRQSGQSLFDFVVIVLIPTLKTA